MNDQEQPKESKLKKFAGFAVVVGLFLGYKFWKQGGHSDEIHAAAKTWIVDAEGYDADPQYYDQLLQDAHETAFDASYKMGSRRKGASFDADKYFADIFASMQQKAQADGREDVASSIEATYMLYKIQQASNAEGDG